MVTQTLNLLPSGTTISPFYILPASNNGKTYKVSISALSSYLVHKDIVFTNSDYAISYANSRVVINYTGSGLSNLTIPNNNQEPILIGTTINIANNSSTGSLSLVSSSGVSVNSALGFYVKNYGSASLTKIDTNSWILSGDISPFVTPTPTPTETPTLTPTQTITLTPTMTPTATPTPTVNWWSFVTPSLLLHFDGEDNSTIFIDTANNYTVTAVGNAKLTTTENKFGSAALYLDGTGSVATTDPSIVDFLADDFTIDCWVYLLSEKYHGIISADGYSTCAIGIQNDGSVLCDYKGLSAGISTSPGQVSTNTWTHIAVTRASGTVKIFINGSLVNSGLMSNPFATPSIATTIGNFSDPGFDEIWSFNGYIDELRIIKGVAVYTDNFTPIENPYPEPSPTPTPTPTQTSAPTETPTPTPTPTPQVCYFTQIASGPIADPSSQSLFGHDIDLNSDGTILAAISRGSNTIKVYNINSSGFTQRGNSIDVSSLAVYPEFISLSDDGNILVLSSASSDVVISYEYSNSQWIQKGSSIVNSFTSCFAMNGDGSIVAVGIDGFFNSAGSIKIYDWTDNNWVYRNSINYANSIKISNIKFNNSGNIIAVSTYNDAQLSYGVPVNVGELRVYENDNGSWTQKGTSFVGTVSYGYLGRGLDINYDGSIIAYGNFATIDGDFKGVVYVYEWDNNQSDWIPKGSPIATNQPSTDVIGQLQNNISMNNTGTSILLGSPPGYGNESSSFAELYVYFNSNWAQCGPTISDLVEYNLGTSVTINSIGDIIAISAPTDDLGDPENTANFGSVRVYFVSSTAPETTNTPTPTPTNTPTASTTLD